MRGRLMGMPLDCLTRDEAVGRVRVGLEQRRGGSVLTPNVDILRRYRRSPSLRRVFEETELLVPDGMPLVWAARLQGTPVPERVTGTDMLWAVAAVAAEHDATIVLAGGREGVAQRAAERMAAAHPGLNIRARSCYVRPETAARQIEELAGALVALDPDVVYVGLPFDIQVQAISRVRPRLPRTWFIGVGSSFDFVTGDRPRAPKWVQRAGLEWAHRLVYEPQVWRRYLVHGLPFAGRLGIHAIGARMRRERS